MATNIELDATLLKEAQELGQHATKRATVNAALLEYVRNRRSHRILDLFGKVEFIEAYDPKSIRSR
jgi:Arc/MetJ family transcription regulator